MSKKRVMVDMSATIIHTGHINILKKASKMGNVIVALTTDKEIYNKKGYYPEISYYNRKKIISSIRYVSQVIASKWLITDEFLKKNNIDFLIHGSDNQNKISRSKLILIPRTKNISTSNIRKKISHNVQKNRNN